MELVLNRIYGEGELRGKLANLGLPGRTASTVIVIDLIV